MIFIHLCKIFNLFSKFFSHEASASTQIPKMVPPPNPVSEIEVENEQNRLRRSKTPNVLSHPNSHKWNNGGNSGSGGGFSEICIKASGEIIASSNSNENHKALDNLHIIINNKRQQNSDTKDNNDDEDYEGENDQRDDSGKNDSSNEKRTSHKNQELWNMIRSIIEHRRKLANSKNTDSNDNEENNFRSTSSSENTNRRGSSGQTRGSSIENDCNRDQINEGG